MYKEEFVFENYFNILPNDLAFELCKYRSMNHRLPIEKGIDFRILLENSEHAIYVKKVSWVTNFTIYFIVLTLMMKGLNIWMPIFIHIHLR